jgi:hypothetical protein
MRLAVIGGGAAGIFGAIAAATTHPDLQVVVFEATGEALDKVRISGGGRCNVTHACFDPTELVKNYPRGHKELLGPFNRFQPRDTIAWFQEHGVVLKIEADGRMFPTTDSSETVVDCLLSAAHLAGVAIRLNARVTAIRKTDPGFAVQTHSGATETFNRLLLATGSSPLGFRFAASLGHTIVPAVPSLFTFKVIDPHLEGLSGISFPQVELTLTAGAATPLHQRGPMLITHWGLSGPAVLKLSAWGARMLHEAKYKTTLTVNFAPDRTSEQLYHEFVASKKEHGKRRVINHCPCELPKRYWQRLVTLAGIDESILWTHLTKERMQTLLRQLVAAKFQVRGKGVFKEEFVTCGGVDLKEVDFKTMQSRVCPGLYLAGEVLDIDGITGGFNFQSAWTTGMLAGKQIK